MVMEAERVEKWYAREDKHPLELSGQQAGGAGRGPMLAIPLYPHTWDSKEDRKLIRSRKCLQGKGKKWKTREIMSELPTQGSA